MNRSARYAFCLLLGVLWAAALGPSGSHPSWALANQSGSASAADWPEGLDPAGLGLDRLHGSAKDRTERTSPGNRCGAVARPEQV